MWSPFCWLLEGGFFLDALFFTLALLPAFLLRETGYGHIVGCCHIADLSLFCFFIGQLFHRPGQCTEVADTLSPAVEKGAIQTRLLLLLKNFLITNLYLRTKLRKGRVWWLKEQQDQAGWGCQRCTSVNTSSFLSKWFCVARDWCSKHQMALGGTKVHNPYPRGICGTQRKSSSFWSCKSVSRTHRCLTTGTVSTKWWGKFPGVTGSIVSSVSGDRTVSTKLILFFWNLADGNNLFLLHSYGSI